MATAIYMPKQGMSMTEGTLIRWLKKVGDTVELNEPIMEIETDKITMEAEAPASGTILAELAGENTVIPVLQTMGWIGQPGEAIPAESAAPAASAPAAAEPAPAAAAAPAVPAAAPASNGAVAATPYARAMAEKEGVDLSQVAPTGRHGEVTGSDVKASPLAARLAAKEGVDLGSVSGSGWGGKVMKADVERAAARGAVSRDRTERRARLTGMRRVIGQRMLKSVSEIPSAAQMLKADVTELTALRARVNEGAEKEQKITVNDFVVKAVAKALSETPEFRARIEGDELVSFDYVNLGVAVSVDGGLLVPVLEDADLLTLSQISARMKDFSARARTGKLLPDELQGSCFSVSNLGAYGIEYSTPIINQPDSGILGVGGIRDELVLRDGQVTARKMMGLSLAFDHRINDGVPAARFLGRIKALLENPISILI